jgi:hypothetical protein
MALTTTSTSSIKIDNRTVQNITVDGKNVCYVKLGNKEIFRHHSPIVYTAGSYGSNFDYGNQHIVRCQSCGEQEYWDHVIDPKQTFTGALSSPTKLACSLCGFETSFYGMKLTSTNNDWGVTVTVNCIGTPTITFNNNFYVYFKGGTLVGDGTTTYPYTDTLTGSSGSTLYYRTYSLTTPSSWAISLEPTGSYPKYITLSSKADEDYSSVVWGCENVYYYDTSVSADGITGNSYIYMQLVSSTLGINDYTIHSNDKSSLKTYARAFFKANTAYSLKSSVQKISLYK